MVVVDCLTDCLGDDCAWCVCVCFGLAFDLSCGCGLACVCGVGICVGWLGGFTG